MVIDYSGGLSPSHAADVKISKKNGTIENRPVEESGNSDNTNFDNRRQDINKKEVSDRNLSSEHNEVVLYNGRGSLENKNLPEDHTQSGEVRIDLIV